MKPQTEGQAKILTLTREAFENVCRTLLRGEDSKEAMAALTHGLAGLALATKLAGQIEEIPEEGRSPGARAFQEPPVDQGAEVALLLGELDRHAAGGGSVQAWYKAQRGRIERVTDPGRRNQIFDAIRRMQ
jgi:hypothetical protein